ncbi:sulfotransferase [Thalassotalea sp. PLHSN55]|uniref:sulfotransferase n=1 Tax=Thalassotalea sp. PLHSN55 TaxID=3435888 RepID=UPI003F8596A9
MHTPKIYVIGLPRTGTTSFCVAMLDLGFTVAHTAYTQASMEKAQVIADTPIFCDYQELDRTNPDAKFIYLTRDLSLWLPSIQQLLQRMFKNVTRSDGGFNPILKRCFQTTFSPLTLENINSTDFLTSCYQRHFQQAQDYFNDRPSDFLSLDVSEPESYQQLLEFLSLEKPVKTFERINIGGKITAWNKIKHPLKIDANLK